MARDWFGRKTESGDLSELGNYYDQPPTWKLWVRRIVGLVAILALLFAFAWAAMWVYGSVTDSGVDESEGSGEVTAPKDDAIDDSDSSTTGGAGDDSTGASTTGDSSSTGTDSNTTTNGSESSADNTTDADMPQTGDDTSNEPVPPTDVLPATGG